MPVALTRNTLQQQSLSKEGGYDFFVTDFQVESFDGLYRFLFSGEVPFSFVMFFLDEVSRSFAKSGALITFKEIVDNQSATAKEIEVDRRLVLFHFMFRDREKLMSLLGLAHLIQRHQ